MSYASSRFLSWTNTLMAPSPDTNYEPHANCHWRQNNTTIQAFLFMKCASSEHQFIEKCTTAEDIWTTLKKCHVHQGAMSQVILIQEAFSLRYSPSTPFADTTLLYCNLNQCIWDMGTPTPEGFLCIMMLLGLSADNSFSAVCNSIISGLSLATSECAYTSANIITRLDYEQQARSMALARTVPVPSEAHVA